MVMAAQQIVKLKMDGLVSEETKIHEMSVLKSVEMGSY